MKLAQTETISKMALTYMYLRNKNEKLCIIV